MRYIYSFLLFFNISYHSFSVNKSDTSNIYNLFVKAKQVQKSNSDSAFALAKEGYKLSQEIRYTRGMGMAFMRMGSILCDKGNNDEALLYSHQALNIRIQQGDITMAAATCSQLSYIFNVVGVKDSAFFYLYKGLRYYEVAKDPNGLANTYSELGRLFNDYKDSVKALKYLEQALQIFLKLNDFEDITAGYSNLGDFYFGSKNYQTALKYYNSSYRAAAKAGNIYNIANSYNNMALCYTNLKEYEKAKLHYFIANSYYLQEGYKNDIALVYYNLGILYDNTNKLDSSLFFFDKSLALSREINNPNYVANSLKYLAYVYSRKGDFLKAYNYHIQYTELSDSLLNNEKVKQIANMQTKYETEKKEQQIALLDEQNNSKAAQRNFLIAGSIVLLLGLFVLGFYYIQRNRLAKKNEQISQQEISKLLNEQELKSYNAMIEGQEEERKRIATDLHDRLGSMLSTVKLLFSSLDTKIDKAQEENTKQYIKANELLDEACVEVRRISHNLSTGMVMSFGLVAALQELCESIDNSNIIKCKLLVYGMDERLEQKTEIGIYRMIQELFNNILKHAKAKQVTVQLNRVEDAINVTVEDDGVGFNLEEKRKSGGMGLGNLETRATQLNGAYHVDSKPGKGTISIIEIPINKTTI